MWDGRTPNSTVRIGDDPTEWPADWQISGEGFGLVDWHLTAHGDGLPDRYWYDGSAVAVRLSTPLGVFVGEAVAAGANSLYGRVGITVDFMGSGLLRIAEVPS